MKNGKNGHFKIEKGIPIPVGMGGRRSGVADALRKLEVGDSVLIPGVASVAFNAIRYVGGNKTTHTARREKEGYRVWRIA
jgi:hypothetical protein